MTSGWRWIEKGNRHIDDGSELFGNTTLLKDGTTAANGYVSLAELDVDRDGTVTSRDPAFAELVVWSDANRNGYAEDVEVKSLPSVGVSGLSVRYRESRRIDRWGNRFALWSVAMLDGQRVRVATVDVYSVA